MAGNTTDSSTAVSPTDTISPPSNKGISERRAQNSDLYINKLPPELLLHIFMVGQEMERITRSRPHSYISFQETITVRSLSSFSVFR
jgi:hypothetical protein